MKEEIELWKPNSKKTQEKEEGEREAKSGQI